MMRVITGSARSVRLQAPAGMETRPTAERVKEAVFSMLQFDIEGRAVLDLFAGSGQMGIEALSRGARSCVFVERSGEAAAVVKRNLQATRLADRATLYQRDAQEFCQRSNDTFDIVFLDPPYASGLLEKLLPTIAERVNQGGTIVCETAPETELPEQVGAFAVYRDQRYGKVRVRLYRRLLDQSASSKEE